MKEYNAVGVVFRRSGKIYDFLSNGLDPKMRDFVVVEAVKGEDIAQVVVTKRDISVPDEQEMKLIKRIATEEDIKKKAGNRDDEISAFETCKKLVLENKLDMKLLFAEYSLDRSKLTFYFSAEGRIDFRQLVRDLARVFHTRIEMCQVGVRDTTKLIGGFGVCGREFCCSCFLRRFDNISIKMAKNQNLILNPNKISGVCGRLMCCLTFEKDQYACPGNCQGDVDYIEINDVFDEILEEDKDER